MFIPQAYANLRDMCVVFAGPFPAGFSEREVKRADMLEGRIEHYKKLERDRAMSICIAVPPFSFAYSLAGDKVRMFSSDDSGTSTPDWSFPVAMVSCALAVASAGCIYVPPTPQASKKASTRASAS